MLPMGTGRCQEVRASLESWWFPKVWISSLTLWDQNFHLFSVPALIKNQRSIKSECKLTDFINYLLDTVQFSSVAQSCLTLCNPMNCSTPGPPVHHQLPEPSKPLSIESVMPSNHLILCHPLLLLPSIFRSIRVFSNGQQAQVKRLNIINLYRNANQTAMNGNFLVVRARWSGN